MIKVTIDIIPYGRESYKRTLSTITIGNMETRGDLADYKYWVESLDNVEIVSGVIKDFPREELAAYDLINKVIKDILNKK